MKKEQTFQTVEGPNLVVRVRRASIIFEIEQEWSAYRFPMKFSPATFNALTKYLEVAAHYAWTNFEAKPSNSPSSDYTEYYDRDVDGLGYLRLDKQLFIITRPSLDSRRVYKFTKVQMQAFLFDCLQQELTPV